MPVTSDNFSDDASSNKATPWLTTSAANLRRLAMIRLIFIGAVLAALLFAYRYTDSDLVHPAHLSTLSAFALMTVLTYWRLQQAWPVTDLEYFGQLLFDIIGLTTLLYFSGGANNPFVSYYLVPLTISAALLPWRFTWIIAGLSLLAYSLMLFYFQPLTDVLPNNSHQHHGQGNSTGLNLHILGMWFTFALSSGLITYFVVKMANALRQQNQQQVANREDELRDEQILAVATLAAGTAHEMGTPLATMTVLLEELQAELQQSETQQEQRPHKFADDIALLSAQVDTCRRILAGLVSTAEIHSHHQKHTVVLYDYIDQLLLRWQIIRPQAEVDFSADTQTHQRSIDVDASLEQAISNLLHNAADASTKVISITVNVESAVDQDFALITVRDQGPGLAIEIAEQIGKPFVSTKGKGLGLGLFLSHATVDRYGGSIKLYNRPQGGTQAELRLPLKSVATLEHGSDGGLDHA